ncbi:phosphate uptake regulator PhoU [Candidatus Woesearchaeota archaeon]|nr:phosphate uptake regulator PhoU [Candidatus Woesearchaeota archaeon]
MKRKLIQLSPSTNVVSLPSKWIQKNKLKKGTEIELEEVENRIIVSNTSKKTEKEITIDISNLNRDLLWRAIDSVYIAGYDIIGLKTKDHKQTAHAAKTPKYFPGLIVTDERRNSVRFKDITGDNQEDVDKILNRIFNMSIAMLEDGVEAIKAKDWGTLADMRKRDIAINSYVSYSLRQLNKYGYTPFSKSGLMHTYIKVIEMLTDKVYRLFVVIGESKIKVDDKLFMGFIEMYKSIQRLHYNYSQEKLVSLDDLRVKLLRQMQNIDKRLHTHFSEIPNMLHDLEEVEMQLNV